MKFEIRGQIRGGKNNMIVLRNGMHIPKPEWARWRDEVVSSMLKQKAPHQPRFPIEERVSLRIDYIPGDLRRRDVPAILDSIFHCLERAGIVKDDSQIKDLVFSTGEKSKYPSTVIEITEHFL